MQETKLNFVLQHMHRTGRITRAEALFFYGINNLTDIIHRLRKHQGIPVVRYLEGTKPLRYSVYVLGDGNGGVYPA